MIVGMGIDIIEIDRITTLLQRQPGFVDRVLTQREKMLVGEKSESRKAEFIAGRFAAKEAAAKALGTGIGASVGFQDMEILPSPSGKPQLLISQNILHAIFPHHHELRCHVSISHSRTYAIAQVIVEQA